MHRPLPQAFSGQSPVPSASLPCLSSPSPSPSPLSSASLLLFADVLPCQRLSGSTIFSLLPFPHSLQSVIKLLILTEPPEQQYMCRDRALCACRLRSPPKQMHAGVPKAIYFVQSHGLSLKHHMDLFCAGSLWMAGATVQARRRISAGACILSLLCTLHAHARILIIPGSVLRFSQILEIISFILPMPSAALSTSCINAFVLITPLRSPLQGCIVELEASKALSPALCPAKIEAVAAVCCIRRRPLLPSAAWQKAAGSLSCCCCCCCCCALESCRLWPPSNPWISCPCDR